MKSPAQIAYRIVVVLVRNRAALELGSHLEVFDGHDELLGSLSETVSHVGLTVARDYSEGRGICVRFHVVDIKETCAQVWDAR